MRWLGWAGVEIEAEGAALVIDPLADPGATFAALGDDVLSRVELPAVVAPGSRRGRRRGPRQSSAPRPHRCRSAGRGPSRPMRVVHEPTWPGGADAENLALAQANAELERAGLAAKESRGLGAGGGGTVRDHRPARGGRARRPTGLLAGRGRRSAHPPSRGHALPRLLVEDCSPTWALRPRASRRSTEHGSTSRTCSHPARWRPQWSRSRRPSPASCSAPSR